MGTLGTRKTQAAQVSDKISAVPMKRFTEADARLLEPGSAIELAFGGHVAPLVRDRGRWPEARGQGLA